MFSNKTSPEASLEQLSHSKAVPALVIFAGPPVAQEWSAEVRAWLWACICLHCGWWTRCLEMAVPLAKGSTEVPQVFTLLVLKLLCGLCYGQALSLCPDGRKRDMGGDLESSFTRYISTGSCLFSSFSLLKWKYIMKIPKFTLFCPPVIFFSSPEGQLNLGLHQKRGGQQGKGGVSPSGLSLWGPIWSTDLKCIQKVTKKT